MKDVKKAVRDVLLQYQKRYGTHVAVAVARKALTYRLKLPESSEENYLKTDFNGEICETVLEMLLMEYVSQHRNDGWCVNKGVILSDPTKPKSNEFLTEIDILLMTPQCFYVFECKSYSGDKVLIGNGYLTRNNGINCNVFKQNSLHLDILQKWTEGMSRRPCYQMAMFDFSLGTLSDKRTILCKNIMPCVNEKTLGTLFKKGMTNVWDKDVIHKLNNLFEKNVELERAKHLAYVKSLHG